MKTRTAIRADRLNREERRKERLCNFWEDCPSVDYNDSDT